ncbi:hypothetical protein ACOL22_02575 [Aliarcobacter butzleri]
MGILLTLIFLIVAINLLINFYKMPSCVNYYLMIKRVKMPIKRNPYKLVCPKCVLSIKG